MTRDAAKQNDAIMVYIHGKGGSADEARRFSRIFPEISVTGLDYRADTPWDAEKEFPDLFGRIREEHGDIFVVANSIGAYFAMVSGIQKFTKKAFFISPVVDMEQLILDMMRRAGVTEKELEEKRSVVTDNGEVLSYGYYSYVKSHPIKWSAPTEILYGENDTVTPSHVIRSFALSHGAGLTVMEGGEHWFHTEEQMRFLDNWIKERFKARF